MKKNNLLEIIWIWILFSSSDYFNALTLILFSETAVGQTGRMTNMLYYFIQSDYGQAIQLLLLSLAFLTGVVVSGIVFSRRNFDPRSKRMRWILIVSGAGLVVSDQISALSSLIIY